MPNRRLIPDRTYKEIYRWIPIACVDTLVVCRGRVLFGRRVERPARGRWFPPGGRIRKGELMTRAASRTLKDEFGINAAPERFKLLTVGEMRFRDSSHGGSKHTLGIVFLLRLDRAPKLRVDPRYHCDVRWFSEIDPGWHPYVRMISGAAGLKARRKRKKL